MRELRPVGGVELKIFDKSPRIASRAILVWVVRREQDAVHADGIDRLPQIGGAEHAAGRQIEIVADIVEEWPLEFGHPIQHDEPLEIKQHQLTPVPEDDLEVRVTVKDAPRIRRTNWMPASKCHPRANVDKARSTGAPKPA